MVVVAVVVAVLVVVAVVVAVLVVVAVVVAVLVVAQVLVEVVYDNDDVFDIGAHCSVWCAKGCKMGRKPQSDQLTAF